MKIADSLQGYYQLKDGTGLVYTKGNADEGFDVCGVSYNNPTEEVFLADGMTDVMLADDQEHILCRRYDGQSEDDQLVFLTSFEEETKSWEHQSVICMHGKMARFITLLPARIQNVNWKTS